jgi:hypothetical protein
VALEVAGSSPVIHPNLRGSVVSRGTPGAPGIVAAQPISLPDASGRSSAEWDGGPQVVYLGEDQVVRDVLLPIPVQATICEARTFIGWDRGSIGEAGVDVNARGTRLLERSDHKESPTNYDAWAARAIRFDLVAGDELHLQLRASQTGPNAHDQGRSTRVHFAPRLTLSLTGRRE